VSDESMSNRDIAKALVLCVHGYKSLGHVIQRLRTLANKRFAHREIVVAMDNHGNEIGHTTRQNPEREARVADMAVLMGHLQNKKPEALEDVDVVRTGVTDEQVMSALRAAGLTDVEVRVRDVELNYLLKKSVRDKKPAAPGIELIKPVGTTNVYPAKDQVAAIEAALVSGEISLLTGELKQIEGGSGAEDA
jgi:hypothetical protein